MCSRNCEKQINPCNCSTCNQTEEIEDKKNYSRWLRCKILNGEITYERRSLTEKCGCLSHPEASETRLISVLKECENRQNNWPFRRMMDWEREHEAPIKIYQEVMGEAISLIRNGVDPQKPPQCMENHHNDNGTLIVYLGASVGYHVDSWSE